MCVHLLGNKYNDKFNQSILSTPVKVPFHAPRALLKKRNEKRMFEIKCVRFEWDKFQSAAFENILEKLLSESKNIIFKGKLFLLTDVGEIFFNKYL